MQKNAKNITQMKSFLQNPKKWEMEILTFFVLTFEPIQYQTCSAPQNDSLKFSFVKDIHEVGEKKTRKGKKRPFISSKFWASVISSYL